MTPDYSKRVLDATMLLLVAIVYLRPQSVPMQSGNANVYSRQVHVHCTELWLFGDTDPISGESGPHECNLADWLKMWNVSVCLHACLPACMPVFLPEGKAVCMVCQAPHTMHACGFFNTLHTVFTS